MNSKLHYMKKVAKHIRSLGYKVETPNPKHDLLDVWGKIKGKQCFVEIYLHAFSELENGFYGVWGQGENDDEELFLSKDSIYGLDTRFFPLNILDDLKPLKKGKTK